MSDSQHNPGGEPRPHLLPADTPDYMAPAWASCMHWAIGNPDIIAQFRADTGNRWAPARNGLERAIDAATGADQAFVEAFIAWAKRACVGADVSRWPPTLRYCIPTAHGTPAPGSIVMGTGRRVSRVSTAAAGLEAIAEGALWWRTAARNRRG